MKKQNSLTDGVICIRGAKVHNLKNIDVDIPRHQLTVITGLSGSGKSSLAFDTILAEGQRRYIDTFSAYARSFISNGKSNRPDVESIEGLSPVVAIDQKTTSNNPRSTVGTVTEIYDFLRLLYARVATPHSYISGKAMQRYSQEEVISYIIENYKSRKVNILAPIVIDRKGHYRELFEQYRKKGFLQVFIDGKIEDLAPGMKVNRYQKHYIAVVIDKMNIEGTNLSRITEAVQLAFKVSDGIVDIHDRDSLELTHLSRKLMDVENGISYPDPTPADFSFNTPRGYCPHCKGLGHIYDADPDKLFPNKEVSIKQGGIAPLGKFKKNVIFETISQILEKYDHISLDTPIEQIPPECIEELLYGEEGDEQKQNNDFLGVAAYIASLANEEDAPTDIQRWAKQYMSYVVCPTCKGSRLNTIATHYKLGGHNIHQLCSLDIDQLRNTTQHLLCELSPNQQKVGSEILKEISQRLTFLIDIGLGYLNLNRSTGSLSGGEAQRIRLATQIGTGLVEVLYILDEPGIGLHQRDNRKLIDSLHKLRDAQNTILVVEHDRDMMLSADYIIDMGPGAGRLGGHIVFAGTPSELSQGNSLTTDYLTNKRCIPMPPQTRAIVPENAITLWGAKGNNLRGVDISIPLGTFVCVTGVSGSGKSSLINGTLVPILMQKLYHSKQEPLPYSNIEGTEKIDKVVVVDQSPLGRTLRSNPATYTGLFTEIRSLYTQIPESKARGYKPGRFSFNVKGGRCENCAGNGYKKISMNYLPDVIIPCEECSGKRYNRETLEVRYKGKSIADVLDMTINQAAEFFEHIPSMYKKLKTLQHVGLGYIKLGQSSSTLSGGENQRIKLASELARKDTGNTFYILDEPTTGLHFEDIRVLLSLVNELIEKGNTVLIIEHNLDVIKSADYIIDMGPDGGRNGGEVVFTGTVQEMIQPNNTYRGYTAQYLREEIAHSFDPKTTE